MGSSIFGLLVLFITLFSCKNNTSIQQSKSEVLVKKNHQDKSIGLKPEVIDPLIEDSILEQSQDSIKDLNNTNTNSIYNFKENYLNTLLSSYLGCKKYLVNADTKGAYKSFQEINLIIKKIHRDSPNLITPNLLSNANLLALTTDLERQRGFFVTFSTEVIALLSKHYLSEGQYYIQYCPMAKEGQGASWISDSREVRNPYFGDKMLHCGSIQQTVKYQ